VVSDELVDDGFEGVQAGCPWEPDQPVGGDEDPGQRGPAHLLPPAARVAGGYVVIRNVGPAPDRLIGAASPAAARVEMHLMAMEGGVMKMREVNGFLLPANGVLELKPGAAHLMFVDINRPFKAGDAVPVTLRFERAGERKIELYVRPIDARGSK